MGIDKENRAQRDRSRENCSKSIRNIMKRLDRLKKKYPMEIYFCAKFGRFHEYKSSPLFRPSASEVAQSYPLPVQKTPEDFVAKEKTQ
ncbi:hypothetical protein BX600DRAFT_471249 [Xylariales sp. PMI_506]|nr:hypothetical protein BX600DRAFT_471249 [Xylariales sp. PMI_506]